MTRWVEIMKDSILFFLFSFFENHERLVGDKKVHLKRLLV